MAPIILVLIMYLFDNIRFNFVVCNPPWMGVLCAILDVTDLIISIVLYLAKGVYASETSATS